jgi:hypothetical protein
VIAPENPVAVKAGELRTTSLFVVGPRTLFHDGERHISVRIAAGRGFQADFPYTLIGPEHDDERPAPDAGGGRTDEPGSGAKRR